MFIFRCSIIMWSANYIYVPMQFNYYYYYYYLLYILLALVIIILKLLPKFQYFICLLLAATHMCTCIHAHTHTHTHMQEHFLFIIWIFVEHIRRDWTMEHQSTRRLYLCLWKIHWQSSFRVQDILYTRNQISIVVTCYCSEWATEVKFVIVSVSRWSRYSVSSPSTM